MQNLTQLHHFKLVAQEKSFARAAEIANVTQPAMSNSIRNLEERLGMTLFHRSERPVTMTSAAKTIFSKVDELLFEASNLDQLIGNLKVGQSGHVRLGMTTVFSTSLGGPIIAEWYENHPNVKLDVIVRETPDLTQGLRDGAFDLFVGDARDMQDNVTDLELTSLPPLPGGAFCRMGHPILDITHPTRDDLAQHAFAGTHFPQSLAEEFARFLGKDDQPPDSLVAVNSHNIAALRDAAALSDLILLTTIGCVRNALALGILEQVPLDLGIHGIFYVATRRGQIHHPAVPSMIDKIIEVARRDHEHRIIPCAQQFVDMPKGVSDS